jgi:tetratricopeptide (TPR) repeat protein
MKSRTIVISLIGGVVVCGVLAWFAFRSPKLPPGDYLKQGWAFHHKQQYSNAIATFQVCLKKYPTFSDGHDALARSYREAGEFGKALSHHAKAIQLNAHKYGYYWERGVTYLKMNNYDAAIGDFEMCIEKNDECANCHIGLAMAFRHQGKIAEALAQHDKAIALDPERPDFYWERCVTHRQRGDTASANADLAKARRFGFPH